MPNPNESLDVQDFEGESGIEGLPENSEELWTRLKEKSYVGEDDQNCLLCDFRSKYGRPYLVKHVRSVHLQIKDFTCERCGGKFSRRRELNQHNCPEPGTSTEPQQSAINSASADSGPELKETKPKESEDRQKTETVPETPISPESGLADDPNDPDRVWNHMIKQGLIAEDDFGRLSCSSCGLKLKQGRAALVRHVRSKHMKSCPLCHLDFVDLDSHLAAHNHDYAKGNEGLLDDDDMELELVHNLPEVGPNAKNLDSKRSEEELGNLTEEPGPEQLETTSPSHIEESLLDINPADVGNTWEELVEQNLVSKKPGQNELTNHDKHYFCTLCKYSGSHLIRHVRSVHFKLRDIKCSK